MLASNRPCCEDIKRSTAGVIFLGTPHGGTKIAGYAAFMAKMKRNDPSLVDSLQPSDKDLYALSIDFAAGYNDLRVMCFYEKLQNEYLGGRARVEVGILAGCRIR